MDEHQAQTLPPYTYPATVTMSLQDYNQLRDTAELTDTLTPVVETAQALTCLISDRFMLLANDDWLGGHLHELRQALIDAGYDPDRIA